MHTISIILASVGALALGPLIIWGIGAFSGWRELARSFPRVPVGEGARRGHFGAVRFGAGGYNGCVSWAADDDHLHLALWPVFAVFGHPPMSIPWSAIEFGAARFGAVRVVIDDRVHWVLPKAMVRDELALRERMADAAAE